MNFDRFLSAYVATAGGVPSSVPTDAADEGDCLEALVRAFGGITFNHGLYRVFRRDQLDEARKAMEEVFPEYRGRIQPFGYDWLGRHFAADHLLLVGGRPGVLMLEPGAGEAMVIPANVEDFHNVELVEYADDALAFPFWRQWRHVHPESLAHADCVGYKVPLFLGGPDEVGNLEVTDLGVYCSICGQLRNGSSSDIGQ